MSANVCNKNAVAKRILIDKFCVSGAMVHFTFLLLLCAEIPSALVRIFGLIADRDSIKTSRVSYAVI
jgi:hypothetical protein